MKVRFGICADLHTEYIHDAPARMEMFLSACEEAACDFGIQLGDFCPPGEKNISDKETIRRRLAALDMPFYHVLGNHDMDRNRKRDVLCYLGAKSGTYSYDCGGVHFVVLDGCCFADGDECRDYENGNYKYAAEGKGVSMLSPASLAWLADDLAATQYPTVLFSHQSLVESRASIGNAEELRAILRKAPHGVILAICGHEHVDRLEKCEGVYYYCLNSMSYYWAGRAYDHETYGLPYEGTHPMLRCVFPYRDPLFAIVEIEDGEVRITGRRSEIVGKTPAQMGFTKAGLVDPITASVIDRVLLLHS